MVPFQDSDYSVRLCLVPSKIQGVNAHGIGKHGRHLLSVEDWSAISQRYCQKGYCEACGPDAPRLGGLLCHEDWGYSLDKGSLKPVASLRRLQVLCRTCHDMLHGTLRAGSRGKKKQAMGQWLAEKNGQPVEDMIAYYESKIAETIHLQRKYARADWTFDLSVFRMEGVKEACLDSRLKDARGVPLIRIIGLDIPQPKRHEPVQQHTLVPFSPPPVFSRTDIVPYKNRGHIAPVFVTYSEKRPALSRWKTYVSLGMLTLCLGIAATYALREKGEKSEKIVAAVVPSVEDVKRSPLVAQEQRKLSPVKKAPAPRQKQAASYAGGIACPIGTTRVISIGPDQLCCDASGTCNAP